MIIVEEWKPTRACCQLNPRVGTRLLTGRNFVRLYYTSISIRTLGIGSTYRRACRWLRTHRLVVCSRSLMQRCLRDLWCFSRRIRVLCAHHTDFILFARQRERWKLNHHLTVMRTGVICIRGKTDKTVQQEFYIRWVKDGWVTYKSRLQSI